ncbi:MAG: winged helix-turn-helix transcriptional regulator, partial [Candidatus Kariarchaeaceae archaeon]
GFRTRIGQVAERFSEKLTENGIFVLGGKSYQFVRSVGNKIIVREVSGKVPTIPSWTGEALSRSWNISREVSSLLSHVDLHLQKNGKQQAILWLESTYPIGRVEATSVVNYIVEQRSIAPVPTLKKIVVESYIDPSSSLNVIILAIFGREVNSVLSQALATFITRKINHNIGVIATDNGFLLRFPPGVEFDYSSLFEYFQNENLEILISQTIDKSELFKTRFRHVASRSLMVLKRRGYRKVSVDQQQRLSRWLLKSLPQDYPIIIETKREILHDTYNLDQANNILKGIKNQEIEIEYIPTSGIPSPLTHDIILNGNVDVVLIEDRRSLLLSLHKQVLSRLLPEIGEFGSLLNKDETIEFFKSRMHLDMLKDTEAAVLAYINFTKEDINDYVKNCEDLTGVDEKQILEIIQLNPSVILLPNKQYTTIDLLPYYAAIGGNDFWETMEVSQANIKLARELSDEISPDRGWEVIVEHYLKYSGPQLQEKIATDLKIRSSKIHEILLRMQRKNIVLRGKFLTNEDEFLLKEDRDALQKISTASSAISEEALRIYRLNKMRLSKNFQSKKINILDFLKENGPCRDPIELVARLPSFEWPKLRNYLINRQVYFGRFLGRRLVFIHHSFLEMFIKVARSTDPLDDITKEILAIISEVPGISQKELSKVLKQPKNKIIHSLNFLEQELYISRTGWDLALTHGGFPQPRYIALPALESGKISYTEAAKMLVVNCSRWYGLLTLDDFLRITRLPYPVIESALKDLEEVFVRKILFSFVYYGFPHDVNEIERINASTEENDEVHLISPYDPYFYTHGAAFRHDQLPRRTRLTIIQGGSSKGYIDLAIPDKDILQVLNLQIQKKYFGNKQLIQSIGRKLLDLGRRAYQVHAVFIEEIQFKAANHQDNKQIVSLLKDIGYNLRIDYLVIGAKGEEHYTETDIIETKQISSNQLKTKKFTDINSLFSIHPVIDIQECPQLLKKDRNNAKLLISNALRRGVIHHKDSKLYRDDIWNTLPIEDAISTTIPLKLFKKPITLRQLSSQLDVDPESLVELIKELVSKRIIENFSPFSIIHEYRIVDHKKERSSNDIQKQWIIHLINTQGPLTFSNLKNHLNSFIATSRIELLVILYELTNKNKVFTSVLEKSHDKNTSLVYYNDQQKEILSNTHRKELLPKWQVYETSEDLFDLQYRRYSHAILLRGIPVALCKIKRVVDEAIIDDLILLESLLEYDTDEIMRELISTLEKYLFSLGLLGLRIKKIQSAYTNYWMNMAEIASGD